MCTTGCLSKLFIFLQKIPNCSALAGRKSLKKRWDLQFYKRKYTHIVLVEIREVDIAKFEITSFGLPNTWAKLNWHQWKL
jgi:hypothetical protein